MDSVFAKAVVGIAQRMAAESRRFTVDDAAIQDPDFVVEGGLVVYAYAGRMHGLDWEGTYLWNAQEKAWKDPYILAATPDDVYEVIHTPPVIPEDVVERLDAIVQPLKDALVFGPQDEMVVQTVRKAVEAGTLSPLTLEIVRQAVEAGFEALPEAEMVQDVEIDAPRPSAPSLGSFGSFG